MARNKDRDWNNGENCEMENCSVSQEQATRAVLQDLRDELKAIRHLMECPNIRLGFIAMQKVAKNTTRKRKPK